MNKKLLAITSAVAVITAVSALAIYLTPPQEQIMEAAQKIIRKSGNQPYKGPDQFFTGNVVITPVFDAKDSARYSAAYVKFEAGARTAWHNHPAGQHLIVIEGTAWTATEDGRREEARKGDAIWRPPNVKHWRGASPDAPMTHIALTQYDKDGKNVNWLNHVSDEEYGMGTQ
jgi:quercetin dioxygenase-like cupin family protein